MNTRTTLIAVFLCLLLVTAATLIPISLPAPLASAQAPSAIAKSIGTIKAINGNAITLSPSSGGPEVAVTVQPNARIVKLGADKDPKNATPIQLSDLQLGDMIRARGAGNDDGKSISALEIIVISSSALAAVTDQIRQDWQKRGMGGIVDSVDPAAGTITLSVPGLAGKKTILVHTSASTVIYRYAPDSAKPENAKAITLQGILAGDQLRARGNRNPDGTEITAEEIYTGVFPKFVGTIKSIDASAGTLSVQDLVTKKTVQVKVTSESQLHRMPTEMAQRFAARLKGNMPPGMPGAGGSRSAPGSQASSQDGNATPPSGAGPPGTGSAPGAGGSPGGMRAGAFDFQSMVNRLPSSTLADLNLQKGDAIVVLTTEGTPSAAPTAITLLSNVEPILQAAPSASQAMMLTPWSLGGAPGGDAGNQ